jgi:hypothetical protein
MKTVQAFNMELFEIPDKKKKTTRILEVVGIAPNVCIEKGLCQGCGRGDRFGIGLYFILHYEDGSFKNVCYRCGKLNASKFELKLPLTESDIFAREEKADLKIIRAARQKMEVKPQYDIRGGNI